jgi:lipopolysaccharide export system permease protein
LIPKLDKLILRTFIGPFIATFFIALFVVVVQFFWKYIDEMVGKGIDAWTLLRLVGIVSLQSGVLFALPIAILLSSLMTFGNLAESFELVAIKSSGISLMRFMRPIFVFVLGICGLAFLFNNYIIPKANLKFFTILTDIRTAKPGFDLKEGSFYTGINNFAIQVAKKNDETGELKNVVIYENSNSSFQDNFIVAEKGTMRITPDKKGLEFILYNGERTQEKGKMLDGKTDFIRMQFKEYKKTFDISELLMKKTADSLNKGFYKMLNLSQLNENMDSLKRQPNKFLQKVKPTLATNLMFINYLNDTAWKPNTKVNIGKAKTFKDLLPDSVKGVINSSVADKLNGAKNSLEMDLAEYKVIKDSLRFHKMEWHRKFSYSVIAMVMLLIGAPLGSIIRRGGLGTPLLVAIIFFVIYFILLSVGEKSANTATMTAFVGIWLPIFVLLPIGIFFVTQARRDSNILEKDRFVRAWKKIVGLFKRKKIAQPELIKAETEQ